MVARTHWLVGAAIFSFVGLLHVGTRGLPVEFGPKTYIITLGLGGLYLLGGTLVWFGAPFGQFVSRVCALIYLSRPNLGSNLWHIMDSPEFKAHFKARVNGDSA